VEENLSGRSVGRPFVQRNEARLQRDQARRELMRVGAERDEVRRERDEALDNLARHKLDTSILDSYINEAPSHQAAFRVFEGEWSSNVPGYGCGSAGVFDDNRIKFFAEQCGGFQGKRVLELGPLEGGHTSMIANAGAANITAIESNTRAFLKCLKCSKIQSELRAWRFWKIP
jgi:hypothetical protein